MNLADVMDEIGTALSAIPDLRVFPFWAERIVPPAAVIAWPEDFEYDTTMARGSDRFALPVTVLVGLVNARASRDLMAAYADGSPMTTIEYVGVGEFAGNGGADPLTPELPSGWQIGDLLLVAAVTVDGTVNTPAGWTMLAYSTNLAIMGRIAEAQEVAPTITFTATPGTTIAQCCAFRGTAIEGSYLAVISAIGTTTVTDLIPYSDLPLTSIDHVGIRLSWKGATWASVDADPPGIQISAPSYNNGGQAAMVWDYQSGNLGWTGGEFTAQGSSGSAPSTGVAIGIASAPTRSIKAAIESGTYTACDSVRVVGAKFEFMTVAGTEFLTATFDVDITGTGA